MPPAVPRILVISHDAGRTGAPIGLLAFMRWLRANTNYNIGTILRCPGTLESEFRELGPTLTLNSSFLARTSLGRRLRRRLPASIRAAHPTIRRWLAKHPFDLVYSNTITNGTVLEAIASTGLPVVTHVHELAYWIARSGAENLRLVKAHTTAYIAASQAVADLLSSEYSIPATQISVVHEHIRQLPPVASPQGRAAARSRLQLPDGAFVVGGCGAEHWRKGRDLIPQLLVALRRRSSTTDFHFLWVGRPGTPDEEAALDHDLRAAGLRTRFHCTGEVSNPHDYFAAMDFFALLSRDDPFPLACLEAAAMEIPVVCFAGAGGMPELVGSGCGLVSAYLDIDAMAGDITRLAQDPALAQASAKRARARIAAECLPEHTGPKLRAIIDRVLLSRANTD